MKLSLESGVYYLDVSKMQDRDGKVKINQIIPLFLNSAIENLGSKSMQGLGGCQTLGIFPRAGDPANQAAAPAADRPASQTSAPAIAQPLAPAANPTQNMQFQAGSYGESWPAFKAWYIDYLRAMNSPRTVKIELRTIKKLEEFKKPAFLCQLTPDYLLDFKSWLELSPKNPRKNFRGGLVALDRHVCAFKKMLRTAESFNKIQAQNWNGIKKDLRVKKFGRTSWHTVEELRQIEAVLEGDLLTAFYLGWQEGLRKSEIAWLYKTDYDAQNHTITIQSKEGWTPKTARSVRTLPLAPSSEAAIKASIAAAPAHSPFIINIPGKRESDSYLSGNYIEAVKKGVPGLKSHLHKLRHTYGSLLAQRGVNIKTISELMGHTSILVTARYTHWGDGALRRASRVIPEL